MNEAMGVIKVCTAFLFIVFYLREGLSRKLEQVVQVLPSRITDGHRQFFCTKSKECDGSEEKVCGYDEYIPFLAVFGDICTMYRANCMGVGVFFQVQMIVCETRMAYDKAHPNETFEFIHLRPTVTEPPFTTPKPSKKPGYILRSHRMKLTPDKKVISFCRKRKSCVRGGNSVCGFDKHEKLTAEFPDICIFYAVNCLKQGRYKLMKTDVCVPNIRYSSEMITNTDGKPVPFFMTYLPSRLPRAAYGEQPLYTVNLITRPMAVTKKNRVEKPTKDETLLS